MKLQEHKVSKYKDKIYYKYTILVPKKSIEGLGWVKGQKLKGVPVDNIGLFLISK